MQLPSPPALHRLLKKRHLLQLLVGDQQVDPGNVHVHDPPRAHVHVPHFAVAHLPFRQTDKWPRSVNQRVGKFPDQLVVCQLPRQRDRIALYLRAESPSIKHRQHDWFRSFFHSASEYMDLLDESLCFRHDSQGCVLWLTRAISRVPGRLAPSSSTTAKSSAPALPLTLSPAWRGFLGLSRGRFLSSFLSFPILSIGGGFPPDPFLAGLP